MKPRAIRFEKLTQPLRGVLAILWVALFAPGAFTVLGQNAPADGSAATPTTNTGPQEAWRLPNDQLDSLVAPIALYPDPLLSQTLVASTYPLEIIQLQQWMGRNKDLQGQALADAVQKQNWDPSIQSMVAVPDVIERLAGNIQWTTELGNAFLAQPEDVMAAVQRMRGKARESNELVSNNQQTVGTEVVEGGQEVIVIQQADPKVVYVPSYDPVVVYGPPAYPYPSYIYPGYVPGTGLAFGVGIALGAAWGNGWGYNCGWHGGDVNINVNNNYVSHYNRANNISNANGGKWAHQPAHRGGAPYGRGGINGVGGGTRPGGVGGIGGAGRPGGVGGIGGAGRPGGAGGAGGVGGAGRPGGAGGISGAGGAGRPGGAGGISGGAGRPGGAATRPSTRPNTQPSSRHSSRPGSSSIGGRSLSSGSSASRSAFGGSGYSGNSARTSSSRGSSSMRSSGYSRGGGGGGGRSGGGGGRGRR